MSSSDETLNQPTNADAILQAIAEFAKKVDDYKRDTDAKFAEMQRNFDEVNAKFAEMQRNFSAVDAQFEAIRQGIVSNNIRFDRLEGNFHLLRAEVTELVEEVRHKRQVVY